MKKKHIKRSSMDKYYEKAISLMQDPRKVAFAEDFVKKMYIVTNDYSQEILLDVINLKTITFFIYSVIEEWENTCK
jgi:hypothetical protein